MSYYLPDLTGADPDYQVENALYTIFTNDQRIVFDTPVFLTSIVIVTTGTVRVPLVQGTDWSIVDVTDIDYTAMSQMKNYQPAFSQVLVSSILVNSSTVQPYQIAITYQKLYPVASKIAVGSSGGPVEFSPDLLNSILQQIASLEIQIAQVPDTVSLSPAAPILLPLDQNKTNSGNVVTEIHTVNTFAGQNLIIPSCGSFFADSVTLTLATTGTVLVVGTDYLVIGLDRAKTRATTDTSGVNNFILLTRPYAGNVTLVCHAYGGTVTFYDMTAVYETVSNINTFLGQAQFLTPTLLGTNPVITGMLARLLTLETSMRNLINSGYPDYSDVTGNGTSRVLKIRSIDTNLHWWTIASLYQVVGSTEVVTSDRMHFRVQLLTANFAADVFVNVNLGLANPLEIDSISVNQDLGYVPYTSYGTEPVCKPQFRILYNPTTSSPSGILLQIGLELSGLTETIGLQDLSGTESCWILAPGNTIAVLPSDGMVPLPNVTYTWDPSFLGSVALVHMMPNKSGYLAWGGALALSAMAPLTPSTLTPLLDSSFNITDITGVRLQYTTTADTTTVFTADAAMSSFQDLTERIGTALTTNSPVDGNLISMEVTITNRTGTLALSVTPNSVPMGTDLVLRHVIVLLK